MSYEFRSLQEHELPAWFDHVSSVFSVSREYFMNHWFQDPWANLEGIRVAVHDGCIASTVRVFDRQVYIGGASVSMAGIGEVSTAPEHRQQGLSGHLLTDAIALMQERRAALSVLFTSKFGHYQRYGWEIVPMQRRRYLLPQEIPGAAAVTVCPVNYPHDVYAMIGIYERSSAQLAGPLVRSAAYWWNWLRRHLEKALLAERDGVPVAYLSARVQAETLHVTEYAVMPGERRALLALLDQAISSADHDSVKYLEVPAAFSLKLRGRLEELATEVEPWTKNIMCRVVDQMSLAHQMQPVWETRLAAIGWRGRLSVDTGMGAFTLQADEQGLHILPCEAGDAQVQFTHAEFVNLLYGQGNAATNGTASDADRRVVQALFPALSHVWWQPDGF